MNVRVALKGHWAAVVLVLVEMYKAQHEVQGPRLWAYVHSRRQCAIKNILKPHLANVSDCRKAAWQREAPSAFRRGAQWVRQGNLDMAIFGAALALVNRDKYRLLLDRKR